MARYAVGKIAIGALIVVIVGLGTVWAIKWFSPSAMDARPKLVEVPPLPPISRSSRIVIPAVITLTALRDAMEQAPRELSGKSEMISGNVVLTARPTLLPEWRVQPNLVSQVTISEATAN